MIALFHNVLNKMISLLWFYKENDCRYIHLQQALDGLKETNTPFVEYAHGTFFPFSAVDDIGIYWLIPKIAILLNCSLPFAIKLFMYGIPLFSYVSAFFAFFLIYRSVVQRIVVIVGLSALLFLTLYIGDTYGLYSSVIMGLVPWALYLGNGCSSQLSYAAYGMSAGICIGFVHYFRGYAGITPLLFMICFIGLSKAVTKTNKILLGTAFVLGYGISNCIVFYQEHQYKKFSAVHFNNAPLSQHMHPIWLTIYVGFGFLKFGNTDNIRFEDCCAANFINKKRLQNPELASTPDETLFRSEVLRFVRKQNYFVIFTLFGKFGVLLLLLLCAANFGLLAAFLFPKSLILELSCAISLLTSAVIPLLTMPFITYSLGFIAFGVFYGIISINYMLDSYFNRYRGLVSRLFSRQSGKLA